MTKIAQVLLDARKIVIKLGSSTLSLPDGTQNTQKMAQVAKSVKSLIDLGKNVVIVSSGAQVAGVSILHEWARKKDSHFRQALCAIGQVELMAQWRAAFYAQNLLVGQLLLVRQDFDNTLSSLNIRNTLFTLIDEGVIPIINENDSVSFEENTIGDNDNLSALAAVLWGADLLILLSDIDGVYTSNPKVDKNATLLEEVCDIPLMESKISIGDAGNFGTGGIKTKIAAATLTTNYGIPLIIANGATDNIIEKLRDGSAHGTLFTV